MRDRLLMRTIMVLSMRDRVSYEYTDRHPVPLKG